MWRMLIGNYPIPGVTDRPNTAKDAIYRKNVKGLPENWLEKLEDEAVYLSQAGVVFLCLPFRNFLLLVYRIWDC